MKHIVQQYHCHLYFAILLHVIVVVIVAVNIYDLQKAGKPANLAMNAYVYRETNNRLKSQIPVAPRLSSSSMLSTNLTYKQRQQHLQKRMVSPADQDITKQPETPLVNTSTQNRENVANNASQANQLLELLHSAIASVQQYPQQALILGQQGTVTVEFTLAPEGEITAIRIVKSSAYSNLDEAGIAAVQAINPFKEAQRFIQHAKKMQINIVFEGT